MATNNIGAISTLLNTLKKIEIPEGYTRFYRGQDVSNHPNPSLFRNEGYIKNEHKMFYDVINQKPDEFSNCNYTFDYLVKMQHYELPTRLLDITSNPLVALYFACSIDRSGSEPTFFYIDVPINLIKNYQSDNVTIFSTLSKYPWSYKQDLEEQVQALAKLVQFYREVLINISPSDIFEENKIDYDSIAQKIVIKIQAEDEKFRKTVYHQASIYLTADNIREIFSELRNTAIEKDTDNPEYYFKQLNSAIESILGIVDDERLLHEIFQDKPYFKNNMKYNTFQNIYCVQAKLDNSRIINQSGAFLLFPKELKSKNWGRIKCNKLSINNLKRKEILNDLRLLNIKNDTLFSELDKVCGFIKHQYKG